MKKSLLIACIFLSVTTRGMVPGTMAGAYPFLKKDPISVTGEDCCDTCCHSIASCDKSFYKLLCSLRNKISCCSSHQEKKPYQDVDENSEIENV